MELIKNISPKKWLFVLTLPLVLFLFNSSYSQCQIDIIQNDTSICFGDSVELSVDLGNYSLDFAGNQFVSFNTGGFPSGNHEATLCSWVYLDSSPSSVQYILGYGTGANLGDMFAMGIYGSSGIFSTFSGPQFDAISYVNCPINGWHYISAVHKANGVIELYLDANLIHSQTVSTPNVVLSNGMIGVPLWGGNSWWYGSIDEPSIWDYALTQQEIQNYMSCSLSGSEAGLLGCWSFDEGSGTTAYDLSTNENDGTINGATYSSDVPITSQSPDQPLLPEGPVTIDLDATTTSEYITGEVTNASSYQWHLNPLEAGTIEGEHTVGTVYWNSEYTGIDAYINVVAYNDCGETSSDTLPISLSPVWVHNSRVNDFDIEVFPNPSHGIFNLSVIGY